MKPQVDQARLRAAAEAASAGDLATAAERFAALAAEHPDDDTIACNLGAVLQALGRDDEAIASYRRAAALGGDAAAMSQYNLGTVLAARGDTDGACAAYRAALERAPELAQAHGNIGTLHYAAGDYAAAETALTRAVELAPDNAWARRNLGAVLCALGRPADAVECYRRAIELDPASPDGYTGCGDALSLQGKGDEALAMYRTAVVAPGTSDARRRLAAALGARGDDGEAERVYRELCERDPDDPWGWNGLGTVYEAREQRDLAQEAFARATVLDPEWATPHYNIGVSLQRQERLEEAVVAYRNALRLDPELLVALRNMGGVLRDLGRSDEAMETYRQVLALEPSDAVTGHLLAALEGTTPERAPAAYVEQLFDAYAPRYSEHMRETLGYRAPEVLRHTVQAAAGAEHRFARALDLGCGTGLTGVVMRELAGYLEGVDLSAEMLARAREDGAYDQLVRADLVDHLTAVPAASFDLILSTDVLIYLGDLAPVFAGVRRALTPGGRFGFTVEALESEGDVALRGSARFAHGRDYLARLGAGVGLRLQSCESLGLRLEKGSLVPGLVLLFAAPSA